MKDKEEFIKGILKIAKNNLKRDGHLLQMLFLATDKGMISAGLVGISSKEGMNDTLGQIGKKFARKGIKINSIFLLSDATSKSLQIETRYIMRILEGKISKEILNDAIAKDAIILLDWDLLNDSKGVTLQYYHKVEDNIIFDGDLVRYDNAVINLLDSFVYNYRTFQKEDISRR